MSRVSQVIIAAGVTMSQQYQAGRGDVTLTLLFEEGETPKTEAKKIEALQEYATEQAEVAAYESLQVALKAVNNGGRR